MIDFTKQGTECADRQNATEGMKQLREAAKDCKTRAEYAAFMRSIMPIDIEEADDGIILHLHKEKCTCVKPECIVRCRPLQMYESARGIHVERVFRQAGSGEISGKLSAQRK